MRADEAAIAADFLRTGNPNLHSVFPQHHASFLTPDRQGSMLVKTVEANQALRRQVTPFDPKPGQVFWITATGTRPRGVGAWAPVPDLERATKSRPWLMIEEVLGSDGQEALKVRFPGFLDLLGRFA